MCSMNLSVSACVQLQHGGLTWGSLCGWVKKGKNLIQLLPQTSTDQWEGRSRKWKKAYPEHAQTLGSASAGVDMTSEDLVGTCKRQDQPQLVALLVQFQQSQTCKHISCHAPWSLYSCRSNISAHATSYHNSYWAWTSSLPIYELFHQDHRF